jgi:hypothetical protein
VSLSNVHVASACRASDAAACIQLSVMKGEIVDSTNACVSVAKPSSVDIASHVPGRSLQPQPFRQSAAHDARLLNLAIGRLKTQRSVMCTSHLLITLPCLGQRIAVSHVTLCCTKRTLEWH